MAWNHVVSGSSVSWNTVPAVSRSCFLQRLHWKTLRAFSSQKPRPPQAGQVRPSRQRIANSAARHASSVPNRSRNSTSLRPLTARRKPSAVAIRPLRQPRRPRKL